MKRLILFVALLVIVLQSGNAQRKKDLKFDLSFGIGILSTFFKDKGTVVTPPLNLNFAHKLRSNFSLGLSLGYSATRIQQDVMKDDNPFEWVNRYKVIQFRGAVHMDKLKLWDIYGGMWIAYHHSGIELSKGSWEKLTEHTMIKPSSGKLNVSAFVGARFAINSKIGIYSELGLGISLITTGLSYQF